MKSVVNKLRLDLNKDRIRSSISICQGDTLSRAIHVTLLASGEVLDIPPGSIATLIATKPDGKEVYNDCIIAGNEVIYDVTNQLIAAVGDVECNIELTQADGTSITSPTFLLRVYQKRLNSAMFESSNEYTGLQSYCARAEAAASSAEAAAREAKDALKDAANSGSSSSGGSSSGSSGSTGTASINATVSDGVLCFEEK